jgi:hypothetical protein
MDENWKGSTTTSVDYTGMHGVSASVTLTDEASSMQGTFIYKCQAVMVYIISKIIGPLKMS